MTTRIILLLGFSFITLRAGETSPENLLRQGLFEEEANHDLDKATTAYQAVIAAHDRQRSFAATATFRLGEIARKKNDKEAAAAAFRTVAERYPEQKELARLSSENLTALGIAPAGNTPDAPLINDTEDAEIARIKKIARDSPDLLDGAGTDGWRPLHIAASKGWTRVVSYLLENNAAPNGRTITEQLTPLQLASAHGYLGTVKALLAAGADPNLTTQLNLRSVKLLPMADTRVSTGDWNALNLAIVYNRSEIARALIEAKTDLTRRGPVLDFSNAEEGATPLGLAIYLLRNELANTLVGAGAPLNSTGKLIGCTPLMIAVRYNPEMVVPLLKAGADPNEPYSEEGSTPLQGAAGWNRIETAEFLIDAGADVNAKDSEGRTPMHSVYSPEMLALLISKGAVINSKSKSGLTPLDVFAESGFKNPAPVFEAFLKHGASVEDPIALLRRCAETNLPSLREFIVYPRTHRPDAVLLSVSGYHPYDPTRQSRPTVITLETRPSPASPPPSLAEALCETLGNKFNSYPQSIRILRRSPNEAFETILEWKPTEGASLPTDCPALEWGDIVEVNAYNNSQYSGQLRIGDLSTQIPSRNVTFRLGDLEIPKTIPGTGVFWLDENSYRTLAALIPNIQLLADLSQFIIHRKGTDEPIKIDFTKAPETRFRLIDGDVVEMPWNLAALPESFANDNNIKSLCIFDRFEDSIGFKVPKVEWTGWTNLVEILVREKVAPRINFRKILVLRRAENWKPEIIDFKAWLDALPPYEKWERAKLHATLPKLNPGDLVVLSEDPSKNAKKAAAVINEKLRQLFNAMKPRISRPRFAPPSGHSD